MTDLSTTSGLMASLSSPRTQMNARIAAAASAGTISATDQTALGSALNSIGASLASSGPSTAGMSMKDRIGSLIDAQTSSGKLTADQASELKSFFAQGAPGQGSPPPVGADGSIEGVSGAQAAGGAGRVHGGHMHHAHGAGGPKPSDTSTDDTSGDSSNILSLTGATGSTAGTSTDSTSSTAADQLDKMIALLEKLRASVSPTDSYSPSGTASASSGLVLSGLA